MFVTNQPVSERYSAAGWRFISTSLVLVSFFRGDRCADERASEKIKYFFVQTSSYTE